MKIKTVYVLMLTVITALPVVVTGQVRKEPQIKVKASAEEDKAREQTRWMYRNLTLVPDQYEKVNEINLTYAFKCDSVEKLKDKNARTEARAKLKQTKEAGIKAVLTAEQYKLYLAHKEKQLTQTKSPFSGSYLQN